MQTSHWLKRFFLGTFVLCFFSLLFIFFCFPMRSFQVLLGQATNSLRYYEPGLLIFCLGSLVTYLLYKIFELLEKKPHRRPKTFRHEKAATTTPLIFFQILMSLFIFGRVIYQSGSPLHWEENSHFIDTLNSPLKSFNPFLSRENHTVSNLAAFASVKLFGLNKYAIRLPSLLFTLLFLVVLNLMCAELAHPFTTLLIFSHLLLNQKAIWYMHSMRGYIPAMLFTLICFWIILRTTRRSRTNNGRSLLIFGLCSGLAISSHTFGGIFCLVLFLSFLLWLYLNRDSIDFGTLNDGSKFLLVCLAWLPVFASIGLFQSLDLERVGDLFTGNFPNPTIPLLRTAGITRLWWGKLILLVIGGLLAYLLYHHEKVAAEFESLFLFTTFFFFLSILWVTKARLIEGRFFLPFLVPFLYWLGENIGKVKLKSARVTFAALAIFAFAYAPFHNSKDIYIYLTGNIIDFDKFVSDIRRKTNDLPAHCYSSSGQNDQTWFVQQLHFRPTNPSSPCPARYHMYFPTGNELTSIVETPNSNDYKPLYSDRDGRTLYKIVR